jgi:hypothetical protein
MNRLWFFRSTHQQVIAPVWPLVQESNLLSPIQSIQGANSTADDPAGKSGKKDQYACHDSCDESHNKLQFITYFQEDFLRKKAQVVSYLGLRNRLASPDSFFIVIYNLLLKSREIEDLTISRRNRDNL